MEIEDRMLIWRGKNLLKLNIFKHKEHFRISYKRYIYVGNYRVMVNSILLRNNIVINVRYQLILL